MLNFLSNSVVLSGDRKKTTKHLILISLFISFVFVLSYFFQNKNYQNSVPYYISASMSNNIFNISFDEDEVYDFNWIGFSKDEEYEVVEGLYNNEKGAYKFSEIPQTILDGDSIKKRFGYMFSYGFIAYIKMAKAILPNFGDLNAIIVMNLIIHILSTLFFASLFKFRFSKVFLCLIYGLNPLVLYLATFPYYYYPAVGFSVGIMALYKINLSNENLNSYKEVLWIIATIFFVAMRPTLLVGLIFAFLYFFYKFERRYIYLAFIALTLAFFGQIKSQSTSEYTPWFSAYVGFGAYNNIQGFTLTDKSAGDFLRSYREESNPAEQKTDGEIFRSEVFEIVSDNKMLYLYNTTRNMLQVFGYGYHTRSQMLNYISVALGIITILLFFKLKLYFLSFVIFFSNVGYLLYFPPIAAYMGSTYVLLAFGWIFSMERMYENRIK